MKTRFLVLFAVSFCAPALAQQPKAVVTEIDIDPDGPIHACAQKENGQLRVVEGPDDCRPSEVALSWNDHEPPPPAPNCCKRKMQYVGMSTRLFNGGEGVLQMTRACQETFPGSRMCSSDEVVKTTELPDEVSLPASQPAPFGWVRPSAIVGRGNNIGIETTVALQSDVEKFSCAGWNTSTSTALSANSGLTVNRHGQFVLSGCSGTLKVACCAVVESAENWQGGE